MERTNRKLAVSRRVGGGLLACVLMVAPAIAQAPPAGATGSAWLNVYNDSSWLFSAGAGSGGTITSSPSGLSSDPDTVTCDFSTVSGCGALFPAGSEVTLTAVPAAGSVFVGWGFDSCPGTGTCTVTMPGEFGSLSLGPRFELDAKIVDVSAESYRYDQGWSGTITSSPSGIQCSAPAAADDVCSFSFARGTEVVLTAVPDPGSAFLRWNWGWYQECGGSTSATCTIPAEDNGHRMASGLFTDPRPRVRVSAPMFYSIVGGMVASSPSGITCGSGAADCEYSFDLGTSITLSAAADAEWVFSGWDGECSGTTPTCTLELSHVGEYLVGASFERPLRVIRFGSGSGRVTSADSSIDCGATCTGNVSGSTELTADPDPGSEFIGWGAGCSGTGTCFAGNGQSVVAYFRGAASGRAALINGDSVSVETDGMSKEEIIVRSLGYEVTVVNDIVWSSMTRSQFGSYDLLVVGDNGGMMPPGVGDSAAIWGPVVLGNGGGRQLAGNRVVVGSDPADHVDYDGVRQTIVRRGIQFAGTVPNTTGMYLATGDGGSAVEPAVTALSAGSGALTVNGAPPCGGAASVVASHPAFSDLTTAGLEGWNCSVHVSFPTFPSDWSALAVATDTLTKPTCGVDPATTLSACGQAYILVAGSAIVVRSLVVSTSPESASGVAGTQHTVVANVHDASGAPPVAGQHVDFTVTGINAGVSGTCVPVSCLSDADGNVSFTYTGVHGAGSDTIKASLVDTDGALQTSTSEMVWAPGAGPTLSVSEASHVEGDSAKSIMHLHVTLSSPSLQTVTAVAHIAPETATSADFTVPKDKTLVFRPGQVAKTIAVKVTPDTTMEGDETFTVELTSVLNAMTDGGDGRQTIIDDDPGSSVAVSVGDARIAEGDNKSRSVHVMVSLSSPAASTVAVPFATVAGSATGAASSKAIGDFRLRSGTITFLPGQQVKVVAIALSPDLVAEGNETFTIELGVTSIEVVRPVGTVTIIDDDA